MDLDDNGNIITGWAVDPDLAALMGISIPTGELQSPQDTMRIP